MSVARLIERIAHQETPVESLEPLIGAEFSCEDSNQARVDAAADIGTDFYVGSKVHVYRLEQAFPHLLDKVLLSVFPIQVVVNLPIPT